MADISHFEKAAPLVADLSLLKADLARIEAGTFTIMGWWTPDESVPPSWCEAASLYPFDEQDIRAAGRAIMREMTLAKIQKIERELESITYAIATPPRQLPAPASEVAA